MSSLRQHLHSRHMLACVLGAVVMVVGFAVNVVALAIVGAVACASGCLLMIRMLVVGHTQ
jgi:hypothetical protein